MSHKIGLIGLGMIGEKMLVEFLSHPAFHVTACWDMSDQVCAKIHAAYPHVPIAANGDAVIEHPEVDIVYIGTPPVTHVEYGLSVLSQSKALFMEKPLSISLSESARLVSQVEKTNISAVMNFGYAAGSVVDTLERVIANQEIGEIKSVEIRYQFPSWPLPNQLSAASWITNRNTGGMVREMFSHHVYLIHRILGRLTVESAAISYPPGENTAEDFALASLRVGEIPVRFMGGIGSPSTPRDSEFTLNGAEGSIRISEGQQVLQAKNGGWEPFPFDHFSTSMEARLDQVVDLLDGKPSKLPTLQDGFEVQKVIEELLTAGS